MAVVTAIRYEFQFYSCSPVIPRATISKAVGIEDDSFRIGAARASGVAALFSRDRSRENRSV
jgi:hypothetical protein